jgi:hypothetical protein
MVQHIVEVDIYMYQVLQGSCFLLMPLPGYTASMHFMKPVMLQPMEYSDMWC